MNMNYDNTDIFIYITSYVFATNCKQIQKYKYNHRRRLKTHTGSDNTVNQQTDRYCWLASTNT